MRTTRNIPGMMVNFPHVLNEIFNDTMKGESENEIKIHRPAVNISENDDSYGIELMVPGFKKEDFKIEIKEGKLTVSAELVEDEKNEKVKFSHREFSKRGVKRTFVLPKEKANEEEVSAAYESGILKIVIAKKEEAKPKAPRLVEIL